MATESSKKESDRRQTEPLSILGILSASALLILGVVYVMGYVIVNGYQIKHMNYGTSALQLKHLAAGSLYTFFTFFQVCVVAFFIFSRLIDLKFPSQPEMTKKAEKSLWWQRLRDRAISFARSFWATFGGLLLAYFLTFFFFRFVGLSSPPTTSGGLSVLKAISPWLGTNLLLSLVVVFALYKAVIKSFESESSERTHPQEPSPKQAGMDQEAITTFEVNRLRRSLGESLAGRIAAPMFGLGVLLFSLVTFQEIYGRLAPDFGGGALYRVAINLKSPSSTPSPSSPSADWRESIKSKDSWLLLVDKDGAFVYVLLVDRYGNKRLLEIASSEIEAVEVLADPPISPADARFFIQ